MVKFLFSHSFMSKRRYLWKCIIRENEDGRELRMSFGEYEVKSKPLFASMKRARIALNKRDIEACTVADFFIYLKKRYNEDSEYIEYITFYDYILAEDGFHYNIAYVYTEPLLRVRDLLFDEREEITKDTGWYPMISGSRANFTKIKISESYKYWDIVKHKPPYVHVGRPLSLQNIASDISSTALLLKCEKGNILLDTGFGIEKENMDDIDFIFLSHYHKDHSGGINGILQIRDIPVVLSSITLEYLLNIKEIESTDKRRILKNAVLIEEMKNRSYISNTLEFFESYHCPGAYGMKYKYYNECFIYPGDICLRNGFYDFSDDFNEIIKSEEKVTILADCALVPRGDFANTDKNFEDIVDNIMTSSSNKIFVSKGSELLFNIYICLFRMAIDVSRHAGQAG